MIVILHLWIGSDTFIISFYNILMYLTFVFHLTEDGYMVGQNMYQFIVYIN
jgi:hypothetical protein